MTEKEQSTLPKKSPRKSGKRGIGPVLDPVKDFDEPLRKEPKESEKEESKGSLLTVQPEAPKVANGRMKVFYDKPHFSKFKEKTLIALAISTPVEEAHLKHLPKLLSEGYHDIMKKGRTKISFGELPAQQATFYLSESLKGDMCSISAAKMTQANLAIVQRKGEGTARKVVRLSFRLQALMNASISTFAENNLNNDFWLELENSQKALWDDEEEED